MDDEVGNRDIQEPFQDNAALVGLMKAVEQEELAWADGEELMPHLEGNNSITTTVSISDGALSHNIDSDEVNQVAPLGIGNIPQHDFVRVGLLNLMQAYSSDEEQANSPLHGAALVGHEVGAPSPGNEVEQEPVAAVGMEVTVDLNARNGVVAVDETIVPPIVAIAANAAIEEEGTAATFPDSTFICIKSTWVLRTVLYMFPK